MAEHPGKVQVQQNDARAGSIDVRALLLEKLHCLNTVRGHQQLDFIVDPEQDFPDQPDISRVVFNQKNLDGHIIFSCSMRRALGPTETGQDGTSSVTLAPARSTTANETMPLEYPRESRWKTRMGRHAWR